MRPRPLRSESRNTCLPSPAVNSLQNTELLHLTSFLSAFSALFSPTDARQPFCNQFVPHSFHRHGGVGGMTLWKTRASLQPAINYRLSTVDFPTRHRPALSEAEGSLVYLLLEGLPAAGGSPRCGGPGSLSAERRLLCFLHPLSFLLLAHSSIFRTPRFSLQAFFFQSLPHSFRKHGGVYQLFPKWNCPWLPSFLIPPLVPPAPIFVLRRSP